MEKTDLTEYITIRNLSYKYPEGEEVLRDINLSIKRGECISIVGHNGSGKSTLAKLLSGILDYKSGEIIIDGIKLDEKNLNQINKLIGIVFQNPDNQFVGTTVEDDIAFGLENRQVKKEIMEAKIVAVLDQVGMSGFRKFEPTQLSGGQKQRIAIAGILALEPQIIILDEATAMLDPQGKKDILDQIFAIKKANPDLTLIIITHVLEDTINSDRIIVLNKGEIVLNGTPNEVYVKEKELQAISLDAPFFFRLKNRLLKEGYKIQDLQTVEEIARYLNEHRL